MTGSSAEFHCIIQRDIGAITIIIQRDIGVITQMKERRSTCFCPWLIW